MSEDSKVYIGTKIVRAWPMDENTFRDFKNQPTVVENRQGYQVQYEDGYVSWSPKEVFERCYREITAEEKALAR